MMKSLKFLFVLVVLFAVSASVSTVSARGARIPVGEREYATVVTELPDTEDYMTEEGNYIDLATLHTAFTVVYIPIYVTEEPRLIGYCKAEDVCYELSDEFIAETLEANGLDAEKLNKLTFWHRFGGKILFVAILAALGFWYFIRKSDNDEKTESPEA